MVRPSSAKALSRVRFPPSPLLTPQGTDSELDPSFRGGYNSEMAHKPVTHATSENMPKVPHTIRRKNGTYSFNARYPRKLIEAGKVAKEFNRTSLSTNDPTEARKLAARRYTLHLAEIERLEAELEHENLHDRAIQTQELSGLSKAEKKDLVLQWFVKWEQAAAATRERYREEDDDWRDDALDSALTDLSIFEGGTDFAPFDWREHFSDFLENEGISFVDSEVSNDLVELFRRATIEVQWRTVQAFAGQEHSKRDDLFKGLHALTELRKPESNGHSIAEICERYPNRKVEGKLSKATIADYALPLRILEQFFSPERTLNSLTFEDGERLIDFLAKVPTNAEKRYNGATLVEAARRESRQQVKRLLSPKRQKDIFTTIKAVLNYAVEIGWLERNPIASKALLDKLPRITKRKRVQFSSDDLTKVFSHPRFLAIRGSKNAGGTPAEGRFWVPLLGLFHGMRANEAASLLVCDVKEEDGVPFLWIRETNDDGEIVKRLKTQSSQRRIPIHSELIRMGFMRFVTEQKERSPDGFLFPEMKPDSRRGNRAKSFSQWFGRLVKDSLGEDVQGGPEEQGSSKFGKDFHSFRHAVTDCIRATTESDEKRHALLGWTQGTGKRNAGFDYGRGFKMSDLKEIVDSVTFPDFDPSHLYHDR